MANSKNKPQTFVELIDMFGIEGLANALGLSYAVVQKMRYRNNIKVDHWLAIAEASKDLGYGKRIYLEDIHGLKGGREHHPGTSAKAVRRDAA